ncbi:MAG TPA: type II secretion system protein [Sedimentisphaerales bacterium]|jgi:type II secretory pathway pseudopilin PulG|nr:type II secretion system protein [Sedimentisphaerales bacterium]HNU30320.1 type II secretion system protein [Sedimentisphaerales bacterium]
MIVLKDKTTGSRGTTLVELTVAVAIMATVFAAILPLFAGVRNGAETHWANLEVVQNARVLNEHLGRHLAGASRIVAIGSSTSDDGYVEFEAAGGAVYRCDVGAGGYVEFGPVGDLSDLVGPVEYLRFVGYDGNDPGASTQTPDDIRLVTWEASLRNSGRQASGKVIRGACYLRVGAGNVTSEETSTTYSFATGRAGVDSFAFADQGKPQVPSELGVPAAVLDGDDYAAISADDGQSCAVEVSDESEYAQFRAAFQINETPADLASLVVTWIGRGVNAHSSRMDGAALYLWNFRSSRYDLVQASRNTDAEITLSGSGRAGPSAYVGGDATVVVLVVSNDKKTGKKANTLFTDAVKVEVAASPRRGAIVP